MKKLTVRCDYCEYAFKDIKSHYKECSILKKIKLGLKDIKEKRVYIYSCGDCENKSICNKCHVAQCKVWYNLGLKDAKRIGRGA